MRLKRFIPLLFFLGIVAGAFVYNRSREAPTPATAHELADAMRAYGLEYETETAIDPARWEHSEIDEGIRLAGDELDLQILRIEDRETYEAAQEASAQFARFQGGIIWDEADVTMVFTRRPYVVVVRKEPSPGRVLAILDEVLPEGVG